MGFLNIDALGIGSNGTKTQKTENLNYAYTQELNSIMAVQTGSGKIEQTFNDKYNEFDKTVNKSALGSKFLSENDLLKQGYTKASYMDMNGGVYYEKDGVSIRGMNKRIIGDGKSLSFRNNNMAHFATYDDRGKETGGIVQVKQQDGSIKVYEYDVDIEGNRFIKSVTTSELDYFAEYE